MARKDESEAIQAAGRKWQEANARGDKAGMEAAHREAEALRAKSGYSGGSDGSKTISLSGNGSKSKSSGSPTQIPIAPSGGSPTKIPTAPTGSSKSSPTLYSSVLGQDLSKVDLAQAMKDADAAGKAKEWAPALYSAWNDKVKTSEYSQYDTEENRKWWESFLEPSLEEQTLSELQELAGKQYESPWQEDISNQVLKLKSRQPFTYDPLQDQLYQIAAQQYGMLGERAMQDTLAEYATLTGGLPSSYAMTAAQQAQNEYNAKLNSIIPELERVAYERYKGNYDMDSDLLSRLLDLDENDYVKFADAINRNIDISQYLADYDATQRQRDIENKLNQDKFDWTMETDQRDYDRGVLESDRDYNRGVFESDRDYNRGVLESDRDYNLTLKQMAQKSTSGGGGKSSSGSGKASDTLGTLYYFMSNGLDPQTGEYIGVTGKDWLKKNGNVLTNSELKELTKLASGDKEDNNRSNKDDILDGLFD